MFENYKYDFKSHEVVWAWNVQLFLPLIIFHKNTSTDTLK